jgi:hypothetical protein
LVSDPVSYDVIRWRCSIIACRNSPEQIVELMEEEGEEEVEGEGANQNGPSPKHVPQLMANIHKQQQCTS